NAEFFGAQVPEGRRLQIALDRAQLGALEEGRIVGFAEPQCRVAVARVGGALVVEARRGDIADTEERVAARQQRRGFGGSEAWLGWRCWIRRGRGGSVRRRRGVWRGLFRCLELRD